MKEIRYLVRPEEEGRRVREILRGPMRVSYSAMKSAKWAGRIWLNGEACHVDVRTRAGDEVAFFLPEEAPVYAVRPSALPVRIVYEDDQLFIIDKQAGMASQSSRGHPDDSLENALFAALGCPDNYVYRPVNRLDKGTGGLMAVARTPYSQHLLQKQLHSAGFTRRYLAWTEGVPPEEAGVILAPIGKAPGATLRRQVDPAGKPSVTCYRRLGLQNGRALLLLQLETGRTHQIRVHLSHLGCPVVGDFLYGREDPQAFPGCFALHSAYMALRHPLTGETLTAVSLPDWAKALAPEKILLEELKSIAISAKA